MIAIVPGYISRSVAGSYDNEGIAIFCMLFTYYLWIKSVKTGSILWSSICALAYFYMVSVYLLILNHVIPCLYLGIVMGWIRLPYKLDSFARIDADLDWSLFSPRLRCIQHRLHFGDFTVYANCLCWIPACTKLGAYAGKMNLLK